MLVKVSLALMTMLACPTLAAAQTAKINEAPFDNACVNAAATYVSNSEDAHVEEVRQWIATCEHHPSHVICEETVKMIQSVRHITPLHCKG